MAEEKEKKELKKPSLEGFKGEYFYGLGRRKTATAKVRLYKGKGRFLINNKDSKKYFPRISFQKIVNDPLVLLGLTDKFDISVWVSGGGKKGQVEAVRHGIARALVVYDKEFRKQLKDAGFLKRDPRMKERKKPGLKRARRAPQWRKR